MGLRYRIPFKDYKDNSYVVEIHREDYTGEVTELTGATSCFVVSGTDDDFMYIPVRTSSATINVLDSELLIDLYSINNQFAPVKLYKNGLLEWTGYIKPEQFTQPYTPNPQNIGVECISALATLENVEYKALSDTITIWRLIGYLVSCAKGGYRGVYIPHVYADSSAMSGNVLEDITLIESNFTEEGMNCIEVLEAVCKFLNWTVHDIGGYLYFVDADWKGEYRMYDETLSEYTSISGNEVSVQDIGYNGSDGNTMDVVPGYNKASVKAINNVFDSVVKDEDYDRLKPISGDFFIGTYSGDDGAHGVRKQFLKPSVWKLYQYKNGYRVEEDEVNSMNSEQLNSLHGALMMKEPDYKSVSTSNAEPDADVHEFNYIDSIQIRVADTSSAQISTIGLDTAVMMEGEYAVYADCAISIDCRIEGYFDDKMLKSDKKFFNKKITVVVKCGERYFNGTEWGTSFSDLTIDIEDDGSIKSNKTPFTPYEGISGYVIPIDFFVGSPIILINCPVWMDEYATHYITGTKIRSLKFGYAKKEGIAEEGENGDRVYENVVNESYMSAAEEIEFEISSYNADGATFSKALLGGGWLTDNLYCAIVKKNIRPEELMIRRIVSRYGVTRIKLTEALQMTNSITPITILTERTQPGKTFRMTSGEWDYEQNRLTVQMQEDVE